MKTNQDDGNYDDEHHVEYDYEDNDNDDDNDEKDDAVVCYMMAGVC